jgi:hypothetical protein
MSTASDSEREASFSAWPPKHNPLKQHSVIIKRDLFSCLTIFPTNSVTEPELSVTKITKINNFPNIVGRTRGAFMFAKSE